MKSRFLLACAAATLSLLSWSAYAAPLTLVGGFLRAETLTRIYDTGEWVTEGNVQDLGAGDYGQHSVSHERSLISVDVQQGLLKLDGRVGESSPVINDRFSTEINFSVSQSSFWDLTLYGSSWNAGGSLIIKNSAGTELFRSNCFSYYDCAAPNGIRYESLLLAPDVYTLSLGLRGGGAYAARGEVHALLTSPVPLPAAAPLLGASLASLMGIAWRRRKVA